MVVPFELILVEVLFNDLFITSMSLIIEVLLTIHLSESCLRLS